MQGLNEIKSSKNLIKCKKGGIQWNSVRSWLNRPLSIEPFFVLAGTSDKNVQKLPNIFVLGQFNKISKGLTAMQGKQSTQGLQVKGGLDED